MGQPSFRRNVRINSRLILTVSSQRFLWSNFLGGKNTMLASDGTANRVADGLVASRTKTLAHPANF